MKVSRRDALKASGLALGGLAIGQPINALAQCSAAVGDCTLDDPNPALEPNGAQEYSYFNQLKTSSPMALYTPLKEKEMRISFMGTTIPMSRRAQMEVSIFVEVGPWIPSSSYTESYDPYGRATDSFMFDLGTGSSTNYTSMGIAFRKMDKLFITHLHADHMGDLSQVYCFGPSADRQSPMYVWGPGPSGVPSPVPPHRLYDDGTNAFCKNLRAAMRWHTESFSFQSTAYEGYRENMPNKKLWGTPCDLIPVGDDPPYDGYAMIPIELDWKKVGIAYNNQETGVKITHFPVIHCRRGSIGYKLEWNGLSMIFTGDTKPEWNSINQAINGGKGVDVFIHEMIVPPEIWALKMTGRTTVPTDSSTFDILVDNIATVQNSSHSPQGAFGYLLSKIAPLPRLTVATHFPVSDDTVECAMKSIKAHVPTIGEVGEKIVWSFDTMVLRAFAGNPKPAIVQQVVSPFSDFCFAPLSIWHSDALTPKYHDANGDEDPYAQLDLSTVIPQSKNGKDNWCSDGY